MSKNSYHGCQTDITVLELALTVLIGVKDYHMHDSSTVKVAYYKPLLQTVLTPRTISWDDLERTLALFLLLRVVKRLKTASV